MQARGGDGTPERSVADQKAIALADLRQRIARLTGKSAHETRLPNPADVAAHSTQAPVTHAPPQAFEADCAILGRMPVDPPVQPPAAPDRVATTSTTAAIEKTVSPPPLPVPPVAPPALVAIPFVLAHVPLPDESLVRETTKHLRNIGAVNILIAGQTGVGKSTLVNEVFGETFAPVASGRPVTAHPKWYASDTVPLRILDTRGLEATHYETTMDAIRMEIESSRAQLDDRRQLHMAWVCISTPSSRVQDCEVDLVRLLNLHKIPTILVLTKDDDDDEFPPLVAQIMRDQRVDVTAIIAVRAMAKPRRPAAGLDNLVTATFRALPVAHRCAFAASQIVSRDLSRSTADDYVTAAASAAAAAAVIPVPFADLATLAPILASMLVGISNAYGVTLELSQIKQLLATVLGCLALTLAGGWAVGTILKFIPGPGSLVGSLLNAGVAGGLARLLGKAYIRFLHSFLETNGRLPCPEEIFQIFPNFMRAGRKDGVAR